MNNQLEESALEALQNKVTKNFTFIQALLCNEEFNRLLKEHNTPTIIDFIHGVVYSSLATAMTPELKSLIANDKEHCFQDNLSTIITDLGKVYNCSEVDVTFMLIKILSDYLVLATQKK